GRHDVGFGCNSHSAARSIVPLGTARRAAKSAGKVRRFRPLNGGFELRAPPNRNAAAENWSPSRLLRAPKNEALRAWELQRARSRRQPPTRRCNMSYAPSTFLANSPSESPPLT